MGRVLLALLRWYDLGAMADDLQGKCARIRALLAAGELSNTEIATLTESTPATVRAVRCRMQGTIDLADMRHRLDYLEATVLQLRRDVAEMRAGARRAHEPVDKTRRA